MTLLAKMIHEYLTEGPVTTNDDQEVLERFVIWNKDHKLRNEIENRLDADSLNDSDLLDDIMELIEKHSD